MIKLSGSVGSVLQRKGGEVWFVTPDQTVYEAIEKMAEKAVGALLVISTGKLVGIISERDYARKVILKQRNSHDTPVSDIMSSPPVTVAPEDTVHRCREIMTQHRFRHLPVVKSGRVVGMLSIGDLVKAVIQEQNQRIEQPEHYIAG